MYRRKIMVISAVFFIGLLGVMIWSSYVVSDHNSNNNQVGSNTVTTSGSDIMDGDFGKEHLQEFANENADSQQNQSSDETKLQRPKAGGPEDFVQLRLDEKNFVPVIPERKKPKKSVGRNYLAEMTDINKLILWNEETFPLRVFLVDEANMPAGFADSIKSGINNWQSRSRNFFSFTYVTSKDQADITVELTESPAGSCDIDEGTAYGFNLIGSVLRSAYIKIPKTGCDNKPLDSGRVYILAQHNAGHVLGLQNHSNIPTDGMYEELTYENVNISTSDINTLKYLYNFFPAITNKILTKMQSKNKHRFAEIKNMSQDEIDEYMYDVIPDPSDSMSESETMIAEALDYYHQEDYESAISSFKQALNITSKTSDKAYIYRALAILSLPDDATTAVSYAESAFNMTREPTNEYLIAYANYVAGTPDSAIPHLERLMTKYPQVRTAYVLAAKIYDAKKDGAKLQEISKKAHDAFPHNPPVIFIPLPASQNPANKQNLNNNQQQNEPDDTVDEAEDTEDMEEE